MSTGKLLVLRTDRLGDVVLCSGYLAALAEAWPEVHIDVCLAAETVEAGAILSPALNIRQVPFDRYLRTDDETVRGWLRQIDAQGYDALVVPQFTLGYPEILALAYSQIETRWAFANADPARCADWIGLRFGPPRRSRQEWITSGPFVEPYSREVNKYRALAAAQSVGLPVEPRLFVPGISSVPREAGLLVWPGSGAEVRRWPAERFADAAARLATGAVTVGATDQEASIANRVSDSLSRLGIECDVQLRDPARLTETVRWLAGFETVLTNDTGIAHLAAGAGCRVISVSPSQYQGRFAVHGNHSVTVFADVPCRRCDGLCLFEDAVWPCVSEIEAPALADAVQRLEPGQTEVLLPSQRFANASHIFDSLKAGRLRQDEILHEREFTLTAEVERTRAALGETEAGLAASQAAVRELQSDRDSWLQHCHEAEAQRDSWQALCHQAEEQRDRLTAMCADLEERWSAAQQTAAAFENRCRELESIFPWMRGDLARAEARTWPKISVITPSFRQGRFIEETIQSVLAQNYANFEHIIVDAGSDDETASIVGRYPHVRWVSEPDRGQAHAINKGLLMASGDIVAYLNSDDVYRPGAFEAVAKEFLANPSVRLIVGNCDYIDERSRTTGNLKARYERYEDLIRYWGWDKWYCIPQQSVFWRRDLLPEVGLFDIQYQMVMDYDMWLRMVRVTNPRIINRTLAAFRLAQDTKTVSRTHVMYEEELAASRRRWNLLPPARRMVVAQEARAHFSRKMLDVAEHLVFSSQQPALAQSLILKSMSGWPPMAFTPRMILTCAQLATWRFPVIRAAVRLAQRGYLNLKWTLQRRAG